MEDEDAPKAEAVEAAETTEGAEAAANLTELHEDECF